MTENNDKWHRFARSGKISDYLEYRQVKQNRFTHGEPDDASEFGLTDNKGELHRRK